MLHDAFCRQKVPLDQDDSVEIWLSPNWQKLGPSWFLVICQPIFLVSTEGSPCQDSSVIYCKCCAWNKMIVWRRSLVSLPADRQKATTGFPARDCSQSFTVDDFWNPRQEDLTHSYYCPAVRANIVGAFHQEIVLHLFYKSKWTPFDLGKPSATKLDVFLHIL